MQIGQDALILESPSLVVVYFLGNALVSWRSKKQCIVSRFSTEAEYRSMATTTCGII